MGYIESSRRISYEKKIAVLCGGRSSEREISLISGKNCLNALHNLGYKNSFSIDIDDNFISKLAKNEIDIGFIMLHGKYGEDGCIQGALEIAGIPYTGNGVMACSLTMSKQMTKMILKSFNMPVPRSIFIDGSQDFDKILTQLKQENLQFPLMVKPDSEGSSVGMNKSENRDDLEEHIQVAKKYAEHSLLEEFIQGRDLTVGILETAKNQMMATSILELKSSTGWYTYEAKYTKGLTEFILPARLSDQKTDLVKQLAIQTHKVLQCKGLSRVDFVFDKNENPYILEVNSIPGMTELSDLPAQAKDIGIEYNDLVDIILHSSTL